MQNIKNSLQLVGGALVALILAPVVALFGLTILGLAIGAAALMTGVVSALVWKEAQKAEASTEEPSSEAEPAGEAQPT